MFPGEFQLLEYIEQEYRCLAKDVLQKNLTEYIPANYRLVDNVKLLNGFIENKYISCSQSDLRKPFAEVEIQPTGRDALQRYREYMASVTREKRSEKREWFMLAIAALALIVSIISVIAVLAVK